MTDRAAEDAAIADFWSWWGGYADQAADQLRARGHQRLVEEITPRVRRINPALVWETTRPESAEFALVLSGEGVAMYRPIAERWLRAAPPADATWEFHSSRQPNSDMLASKIRLTDHELDVSHVAFGVHFDVQRARFDVSVYHPDFAFIDEQSRLKVAYLTLDWALGEDDVARWVGAVRPSEVEPMDPVPAEGLRAVTTQIAGNYAEPRWAVLSGQNGEGKPLLATVRFPLRRVDHPLLDQHVAVELPYHHRTDDGLPAEPSLAELGSFTERLEQGADALLVGHVSTAGVRILHFYCAADAPAATTLGRSVGAWQEGTARVHTAHDPGWQAVAPLLT